MSLKFKPSKRWYPLRYHPTQRMVWNSEARYKVVVAGRRSGKTEINLRKLVLKALSFYQFSDGWFVYAAPTYSQAKRIAWNILKDLVSVEFLSNSPLRSISESELTISLYNGARISCLGLDKPERVEGSPLDHIVLDEYANMKPNVFNDHVGPALDTPDRPGSAVLTGVPEGRNDYYDKSLFAKDPKNKNWEYFWWPSSDILSPEAIANAKSIYDPSSFQQEYEASFINFSGRAYYNFNSDIHARNKLVYNPGLPLVFCFDFNRHPGVAVVLQEQEHKFKGKGAHKFAENLTCVIDEVYIPRNSNTEIVSKKLAEDWKYHQGHIFVYGDATGGAEKSSSLDGSDWDIVKKNLQPVFGDRIHFLQGKSNPSERSRVNCVNSRLMTSDRVIHVVVDPSCKRVIRDLDGVSVLEGGSGQLDKKSDLALTHISDALGYYLHKKFYISSKLGVNILQVA